MITFALLALSFQTQSGIQVSIERGTGLVASYAGIPLIRGSFVQYYEPGWTKGYFSSNWGPQEVEKSKDATVWKMGKPGTGAWAEVKLFAEPDGFRTVATYNWAGDHEVRIENGLAVLNGDLFGGLEGRFDERRFELRRHWTSATPADDRVLATGFRKFTLSGPTIEAEIETNDGSTVLLDGTQTGADWSQKGPSWWLGQPGLSIAPGKSLAVETRYRFRFNSSNSKGVVVRLDEPKTNQVVRAAVKGEDAIPRLPAKEEKVDWAHSVPALELHAEGEELSDAIFETYYPRLASLWETEKDKEKAKKLSVSVKWERAPELKSGGYRLKVTEKGVTIQASSEEGVRAALHRLAETAWPAPIDGSLRIPFQTVADAPALDWRGVHLFVGPTALGFQGKLIDRVLGPLHFNRVVLQCERTEWKAVKELRGGINMRRTELAALAERYRNAGIDPIPLIQSLGHAEWLLTLPKYRSLAVNPAVPYTIDPNKEEGRKLLQSIWEEAIALIHPQVIHFGLDEIDMRGIEKSPSYTTKLWTTQLPFLNDLAKKFGVESMVWGDKMLAPGEAPDAAHGDNAEEAKARRAALAPGTWIADWHYKEDANPEIFTSLGLWKSLGHRPVASTWFRPKNIYGMGQAAEKVGGGLLQTTWAGYESSEEAMLREMRQFSAFVDAAYAGWVGGGERAPDPQETFSKLFYGEPLPTRPAYGWSYGESLARVHLAGWEIPVLGEGLSLGSLLSAGDGAQGIDVPIPDGGRRIALLVGTEIATETGTPVARLVWDGKEAVTTLRYRYDLRSEKDEEPVYKWRCRGNTSLVVLDIPKGARLLSLSQIVPVGFRLFGAAVAR